MCASIKPALNVGKTLVVESVDHEETYVYGNGAKAEKSCQTIRFLRLARLPGAFVHDFHEGAHTGPKLTVSQPSMPCLLVFVSESKPEATRHLMELLSDADVARWLRRSTAGIWLGSPLTPGAPCMPSSVLD